MFLHFKKKNLYEFISTEREYYVFEENQITQVCNILTPILTEIIGLLTQRSLLQKKTLYVNTIKLDRSLKKLKITAKKIGCSKNIENTLNKKFINKMLNHLYIRIVEFLISSTKVDKKILWTLLENIKDNLDTITTLQNKSYNKEQVSMLNTLSKIEKDLQENDNISPFQFTTLTELFENTLKYVAKTSTKYQSKATQSCRLKSEFEIFYIILISVLENITQKLTSVSVNITKNLYNKKAFREKLKSIDESLSRIEDLIISITIMFTGDYHKYSKQ